MLINQEVGSQEVKEMFISLINMGLAVSTIKHNYNIVDAVDCALHRSINYLFVA